VRGGALNQRRRIGASILALKVKIPTLAAQNAAKVGHPAEFQNVFMSMRSAHLSSEAAEALSLLKLVADALRQNDLLSG
jgi:hypothetical protein